MKDVSFAAEAASDKSAREISDTQPVSFEEASLGPHRETLLAAADQSPEAFQSALKRLAQTALAEGAANIPIPRSITEYRQMVAVLEAAEKLGQSGPKGGYIRHPAGLTLEAEVVSKPAPVEVDGFTI